MAEKTINIASQTYPAGEYVHTFTIPDGGVMLVVANISDNDLIDPSKSIDVRIEVKNANKWDKYLSFEDNGDADHPLSPPAVEIPGGPHPSGTKARFRAILPEPLTASLHVEFDTVKRLLDGVNPRELVE